MKKNPEIKEDDISKALFMQAIRNALAACGGSVQSLSERIACSSRTRCYAWIGGRMPPYKTMQKMYFKFVEIAEDYSGK